MVIVWDNGLRDWESSREVRIVDTEFPRSVVIAALSCEDPTGFVLDPAEDFAPYVIGRYRVDYLGCSASNMFASCETRDPDALMWERLRHLTRDEIEGVLELWRREPHNDTKDIAALTAEINRRWPVSAGYRSPSFAVPSPAPPTCKPGEP